MNSRYCKQCHLSHPLTSEYWYRLDRSPRCKKYMISKVSSRYQANREKIIQYSKHRYYTKIKPVYYSNRIPADPIITKLKNRLRGRLNKAIQGNFKHSSAIADLGCSVEDCRDWLESKFQPGMTWENYGVKGWHIDHILPLAWFDLTKWEHYTIAVNYTNLQPLWAVDNLRKGSK